MNTGYRDRQRQIFGVWTLLVLLACAPGSPTNTYAGDVKSLSADAPVDFIRQIQPILVNNCYACHGPDVQRAKLRFDDRESVFTADAHFILPNNPEGSALHQRLTTDDPAERMPLDADPLSLEEIELIRRWIREGADWPENAGHWAFQPVTRPELPEVQETGWIKNPIDRFVLQRLETEGLKPSPQADKERLIRRLSLDLTGLPPEPEEVDAFLADDSPQAYEKLVERYLASPHYGERWAQWWLDVARYGDTGGYDFDRPREVWLYRDYVIDSFNRDKPFDQFTIEQLAGDLLPEPAEEQLIATGFIRNSPRPQYDFDVLVDRVDTFGTAFLGLTLECAQCHNHKFDPISQKEFFQLFSLFKNTDEKTIKARSPLTGVEANTLAVADKEKHVQAYLKIGGSFLNRGEPVEPGALAAFHSLPEGGVTNRLALAQWVVDEANPLIGRVTVNRQWQVFFGQGIVRTSEDMGIRTEPPTHPELLDWLAGEFVENGWSFKWLHRQIVHSATYQQSSRLTPDLARRDPSNQLLARGPRFRVEAETVRDIALAASGLLERQLGGPSVFPPQPRGISENRFRGAFDWKASEGPDRYRRGLYTFWKRAALHPGLALFDAPRRETACVRRIRSNTPLQALVTLNDPAYVEAAIHLGRRMLESGPPDPALRIGSGFRATLTRRPSEIELSHLMLFYDEELNRFRDEPAAARSFLATTPRFNPDEFPEPQIIEWAALAMTAGVLLNLDETITKQ